MTSNQTLMRPKISRRLTTSKSIFQYFPTNFKHIANLINLPKLMKQCKILYNLVIQRPHVLKLVAA